LRGFGAELDAKCAAAGGNGEVAVTKATYEVKRLAWLLLHREAQRVLVDARAQHLPHVRCRLKETVGGDEPFDALVRPVKIVAVDEERQAPLAVGEVREDRPREKLLPEGLPEALHFSEGLRMLWAALHMPNTVTAELALEVGLAAPRRVLSPLIGEHLLRISVLRYPAGERLHHELGPLMVREGVRDDEARVIVHEGRQVQPLLASQQEGEDVRLPELIGGGPLEAPRRVLPCRLGTALFDETLLVQNPAHLGLADPECLESGEHVPDPARAVLGMFLPQRRHRVALSLLTGLPLPQPRWRRRHRHHGVDAALPVLLNPVADRLLARSEHGGRARQRHPILDHGLHRPQPERERVSHPSPPRWPLRPASVLRSDHLRLSIPASMSVRREGVLLGSL
jgi:hypothetical protein